jgi:regulator of cell morphogenesis and NO signaling
MTIDPKSTLRQIVLDRPDAARVFDAYRLDYCCGGSRTLAEACRDAGAILEEVVEALEQEAPDLVEASRWDETPLADLIGYIVDTHHAFARAELSRLGRLMGKVAAQCEDAHPELRELAACWSALSADLEPHLGKEEEVLFPYILAMEQCRDGQGGVPEACFGTVMNPIRAMAVEHHELGDILKKMHRITGGYRVPADGCPSLEELYQGLATLETDLIRHIYLENNILFPKSLELEQVLLDSA